MLNSLVMLIYTSLQGILCEGERWSSWACVALICNRIISPLHYYYYYYYYHYHHHHHLLLLYAGYIYLYF